MSIFSKNKGPVDQSFVDHLESLRWHIVRILIAMFISTIICFVYIEDIFDAIILAPTHSDFWSYKILCSMGERFSLPNLCLKDVKINFQNTQLSGQFMMSISSSVLFGFIAVFPYIVYELWLFIKPALTPKELKMSRGSIFWVTLLFFLGVFFGYYIITPYTVNFFANYKISPQFDNIIKIDDYLSTLTSIVLGTGIVFELPVLVYVLSKMGLLTPRYMKEYRRYALVIILIIAAVITPPDVVSQIVVSIPVLLLYEVSISISARVEKRMLEEEKKWIEKYKN